MLAYRVKSIGCTGAYSSGAANIIPLVLGPFVQTGVYDLPLVHFEVKSVMTHTAPVGAYRGAGRPEAVFIVERLFDAAARKIGMDPRAIRKANYIKPAQLPYTNAAGQVYDSGAFAHMLDRAVKLADWDGFAARKKAAKKKGLLYGRGLTSTSSGPAAARTPRRSACTRPRKGASCCIPAPWRWGRACRPPTRR